MAEPGARRRDPAGTAPRLSGADVSGGALAFIALGAAGSMVFLLVASVEGAMRPEYDASTQTISALSLGPGGWIQQANFILLGLVQLIAAVGWRWTLQSGLAALVYPLLRAIIGSGLIMAGIFSQDPSRQYPPGMFQATPTLHGEIHVLASYVTFTALMLSCGVLAARLGRTPGWRGWAFYGALTVVAMFLFISIFGQLVDRGPAGIYERLAIAVEAVLVALVVGRLWIQHHRAGG